MLLGYPCLTEERIRGAVELIAAAIDRPGSRSAPARETHDLRDVIDGR